MGDAPFPRRAEGGPTVAAGEGAWGLKGFTAAPPPLGMAAQNGMKGPPPLKQDRLLLPDLFQLPPSCWFGQKTAGPSLQPLLLSDQGLKLQPGIFLLPAALPLPLGTAASILELNMVILLWKYRHMKSHWTLDTGHSQVNICNYSLGCFLVGPWLKF